MTSYLLTDLLLSYLWNPPSSHLLSRHKIVVAHCVYLIATFVAVLQKLQHTLIVTRSPYKIAVCSAYQVYLTGYCQHAVSSLSITIEAVPLFTIEHHVHNISCIHTFEDSTLAFPSATSTILSASNMSYS